MRCSLTFPNNIRQQSWYLPMYYNASVIKNMKKVMTYHTYSVISELLVVFLRLSSPIFHKSLMTHECQMLKKKWAMVLFYAKIPYQILNTWLSLKLEYEAW